MRRLTLESLRREAWKVLTKQLDVINVTPEEKGCYARSEYDDNSITIWVNHMSTGLDKAVIHEILHKLLDDRFKAFATYHLYEIWITSLEEEFFRRLTAKQINRWHRAIKKKLVIKRTLK